MIEEINSTISKEEEEKKLILKEYRKLLRFAKPVLKEQDAKIIRKAFNVSMEAHKDMRRKSGEPYILHPLEVAQICVKEIRLGTTSIVSALLHDVVEDTDLEISDIDRMFGKKVSRIIDRLTKISGVFEKGSSLQAENFRKLILTLSDDLRVVLIKIADRLHNMRTLESMPRNKQLKIASETIYLYAPLAHRLGLYPIKSELEDLYLKYTQKDVYREIALKLRQTKKARNKFIREFSKPIIEALDAAGIEYTIKGRPKSIYSIWNKMKRQNVPFEQVFDLFAIRIILKSPPELEKSNCWKAYSIVTDFYRPNPDRLRDWISTPKANGYESLHATVMSKLGQWVEVQIRTERMDDVAERGYAAHWKYKENKSSPDNGIELWIAQVRDLLEKHDSEDTLDFLDDFRSNLFQKEVFVFTPKGDLKVLPQDSTALDFAFEIHSEIGARCIGAKVNQKLVPLSHKLNNGDQIEIITSKKQKPSDDWLKFVASSKAKTKIKDFLKANVKQHTREGKEKLEKRLNQLRIAPSQDVINKLLNYFHVKNSSDLYLKIYRKHIDLTELREIDFAKISSRQKAKPAHGGLQDNIIELDPNTLKKIGGQLKFGDSGDKFEYSFAKCCNPIPGDEVFGFVTVSDGIKIHRTNCPNAIELMSHYGYRIIKAMWATKEEKEFLTGLKIQGVDGLGLLNQITNVISKENQINIRSLKIESIEGMFEGDVMLFVKDTEHLKKLISNLRRIQGVESVIRYDS